MRDRIITVDISKKRFKALSYKQYDDNNLLQVVVMRDKKIIDITNCTADIYFELPSGKTYELVGEIKNNTINILLTSKILNEYGKVIFEIELTKDKEIVTVFSMYLNVEKSINESDEKVEDGKSEANVRHSHENKSVLDQITQEMIDKVLNNEIDIISLIGQLEDHFASKSYVLTKILEAQINSGNGGEGGYIDLDEFITEYEFLEMHVPLTNKEIDSIIDEIFKE